MLTVYEVHFKTYQCSWCRYQSIQEHMHNRDSHSGFYSTRPCGRHLVEIRTRRYLWENITEKLSPSLF